MLSDPSFYKLCLTQLVPDNKHFCRYVEGGMGAVSMAIGNAAREAGVCILTTAEVCLPGIITLAFLTCNTCFITNGFSVFLWSYRKYKFKKSFSAIYTNDMHEKTYWNWKMCQKAIIGMLLPVRVVIMRVVNWCGQEKDRPGLTWLHF